MPCVAVIAALLLCVTAVPASAASGPDRRHHNPNPELFGKNSHPYGRSMTTWGETLVRWIYRQPAAHNPILDQTGADCGNGQHGPVWFIPPIAGPHVQNSSRVCTVPRHKAILLDLGANVNDYPCPDPAFRPEPGESLYDFLIRTDKPVMDSVNELDVSLDGHALSDVLGYRFISADLFRITGDPSMREAWDPCITGRPQPAIVDGFFMMFKPLHRGQHTIVVHGTTTFGDDKTYTYHLTVA